jgi:hypothetical protein
MKKNVLLAALLIAGVCANAQTVSTKVSNTRKELATHVRQATAVKAERQMAKSRLLPTDAKVKEVISSKTMKDGSIYRIVKLDNGTTRKQLLRPSGKLQNKLSTNSRPLSSPKAAVKTDAPEGSFFEGFEGWDGEAPDWIPKGWTEESKVDPATPSDLVDAAGDVYNFTWQTTAGEWGPYPTEGDNFAYIQFSGYYLTDDEDNPLAPATHQDEWLISPTVTIDKADYVWDFDLAYDPFFSLLADYDWETDTYEWGELRTVIEAHISTDGGITWTKKWDNREDAAKYTEEELVELMGAFPWLKVTIPLSEYVGQDIKTAIRYINDDGESAYVDAVTIGYPRAQASYRRPEGYLIAGLSKDYSYLDGYNIIVGNAYTPTTWKGNVTNADAVSWEFDGEKYDEEEPVVALPFDLYDAPILSATNKGGTTEFQLGVKGEENVMLLGGGIQWIVDPEEEPEPTLFGLGNYDLQYQFISYPNINAEDLIDYGVFRGVANVFEKPAGKYIFETLYVHAGNVVAKEGEPVKLEIYAVDEEGYPGDLIASSEAWPADFIEVDDEGYIYHTVPFKFKKIDPETGREEDIYLDINTAFVAEFTNYESADIFFQYEDHPTGDGYAYVVFEETEDGRHMSLGATSALFDIDAIFPFMFLEDESEDANKYAAPDAGGTKDFRIISPWTPEGGDWWVEGDLPGWIEVDLEKAVADEENPAVILPVTVAALPEGKTGRSADITLASKGCTLTLLIKQGDADYSSGVAEVRASTVKAVRHGDSFSLSYPEGFTSVTVYSTSGRKVSEHALNASGAHTLPAAHLAKGVYILKFSGKTTTTLKVVR